MRIVAFVGPSGTGKSHRAQMVAREKNIDYIIDDAILVSQNKVVAGTSAKKASTKIESVKRALFSMPGQAEEMKEAIKKEKPKSILILGTSDGMVQKIVANLGLPEIEETIYIEDVSTPEQIATARSIRMSEGKHVIPVPTFEIKKDFSGYLLDPLQIFKFKGKGAKPYISEKSIIRPTFSYLGNYTISDSIFREIIEYMANKTDSIHKINRVRIENKETGIELEIDVTIVYGYDIFNELKDFKKKCKKEIENLTAMNVDITAINAREIYIGEEVDLKTKE